MWREEMARIKRKYIDSHWLIFVVQGLIALLCGWYIMFVNGQDTISLVIMVGVMLLALGIVEVVNILQRERAQATWGISLAAAVVEIAIGLLLVFTSQQDLVWHMIVLAIYTFTRGLCELMLAFRSIDDRTDKFIWGFCGICGIILSFVVLNSGHLAAGTFVKVFASYLVILGVGNLLYGVHNRDQELEAKSASRSSKKSTKKAAKKSTKKTTKKRK